MSTAYMASMFVNSYNVHCKECHHSAVCAGMLQWGNVHLSMARKFLDEAAMKGTFKDLESRIQSEFDTAAGRYREALSIKADFYDGEMQLGQVDFERAKLAAGFLPEPVR